MISSRVLVALVLGCSLASGASSVDAQALPDATSGNAIRSRGDLEPFPDLCDPTARILLQVLRVRGRRKKILVLTHQRLEVTATPNGVSGGRGRQGLRDEGRRSGCEWTPQQESDEHT